MELSPKSHSKEKQNRNKPLPCPKGYRKVNKKQTKKNQGKTNIKQPQFDANTAFRILRSHSSTFGMFASSSLSVFGKKKLSI